MVFRTGWGGSLRQIQVAINLASDGWPRFTCRMLDEPSRWSHSMIEEVIAAGPAEAEPVATI